MGIATAMMIRNTGLQIPFNDARSLFSSLESPVDAYMLLPFYLETIFSRRQNFYPGKMNER
jgi:hypothetical protein